VQEDLVSEYERALEEEAKKLRQQLQEQEVQMISLRMTVNEQDGLI
jgi:hypothetical protein